MPIKIAVFTVCMPGYTPEEAAPALKKWGFDGVEWRVNVAPPPGAPVVNFWSGNRCTVDVGNVVELAPAIRKLCRSKKLAIPSLGTYVKYDQLKEIETIMEAASIMGVKQVRVGVAGYDGKTKIDRLFTKCLKGYEKVVKMGKEYRVKPLAEIHFGNIISSCSSARRFAENFSPSEMGIIHDAGNMVREGFENWQMGFDLLGKHLAHVHVKNAEWRITGADPDGNLRWEGQWSPLRRGQANWCDIIAALKKVGYKGWLSLENFCEGETEAKLKDDLNYLKGLLG